MVHPHMQLMPLSAYNCCTCRAKRKRLFVRVCNVCEITCEGAGHCLASDWGGGDVYTDAQVPWHISQTGSDTGGCRKSPSSPLTLQGQVSHWLFAARSLPSPPSSQAGTDLAPSSTCCRCSTFLLLQARLSPPLPPGPRGTGKGGEGFQTDSDTELVAPHPFF